LALGGAGWPLVELADGGYLLISGRSHTEPITQAVLESYLTGDDLIKALRWLGTSESVDTAKIMEVLRVFDEKTTVKDMPF
jgi:hypothetical protein